ncbi:MAG: histidine kinase, partial [Thioalkalivibrio sp.]
LGTEYDIYFGYGTEIEGFGIDLSYATYIYPESEVKAGDVAEAILGLSYGPAFLTYHHGLEDLEDYWYVNAGVNIGAFTVAYGLHEVDMDHIDLTYNYNDNVSFTVGQVIDDVDGAFNDDTKFVVTFS